ncbi:MAG: glycosyltransferase [Actinomycetia bacterium]|nr:glycosyltransferase [Actinomycetes bacterium]
MRQTDALWPLGHAAEVVANTDSRTGALHALRKYLSLYWRARKAARLCVAHGSPYDLIVGHFLYPNAWIAQAVARAVHQPPYLVVAHGSDVGSLARKDPLARWSRSAVSHADGIVAVSHFLLHQLEETVPLPSQTPRAVINMGFDDAVFYPRDRQNARAELGLPAEAKVIVVVGNLAPVKGQDRALEACAPLLRAGKLDRLIFVGEGTKRAALERTAAKNGLTGRVAFVGQRAQPEVARSVNAADLVLVPSRNEGLGLVVLEAAACGTPVAAATVGGIPEILPAEPFGYLLDPIDVASWPAVIERALEADPLSDDDRKQLSASVAAHSITKQAQRFADFCASRCSPDPAAGRTE